MNDLFHIILRFTVLEAKINPRRIAKEEKLPGRDIFQLNRHSLARSLTVANPGTGVIKITGSIMVAVKANDSNKPTWQYTRGLEDDGVHSMHSINNCLSKSKFPLNL